MKSSAHAVQDPRSASAKVTTRSEGMITAPGCIGSIDGANDLQDVRVFGDGSFAQDWTQIGAV